jgi:hypothetical protein
MQAASIDRYAIVESNIRFDIFGGDVRTRRNSLSRKDDRRQIRGNSHTAAVARSDDLVRTPRDCAHFSITKRTHMRWRPNCWDLESVQQIWLAAFALRASARQATARTNH